MKYPRTARIFRGQLDAAPFAGVFFLLLMFVLLTALFYVTPGVRIDLPVANGMSAPDKLTVVVGVDAAGQFFYENQLMEANELRNQLAKRVKAATEPIALEVRADKAVKLDTWQRLVFLARDAGIFEYWQATQPSLFAPANGAGGAPAPK